jgi:hypothetical protein
MIYPFHMYYCPSKVYLNRVLQLYFCAYTKSVNNFDTKNKLIDHYCLIKYIFRIHHSKTTKFCIMFHMSKLNPIEIVFSKVKINSS